MARPSVSRLCTPVPLDPRLFTASLVTTYSSHCISQAFLYTTGLQKLYMHHCHLAVLLEVAATTTFLQAPLILQSFVVQKLQLHSYNTQYIYMHSSRPKFPEQDCQCSWMANAIHFPYCHNLFSTCSVTISCHHCLFKVLMLISIF